MLVNHLPVQKKNRCPVNIHTVISGSFVRNSRWLSNKFLCAALRHISIAAPHQTGGGANGAIQARHLEGARSLVVRQAILITAPSEVPGAGLWRISSLREQPAHDLGVPGKQISAAMLVGGAALLKVVRVLDVQHQQPADLLLGQSRCCLGLQKPRSVQNRTGLLVNILFRVCFLLRKPPPFSSSFPFFRKNPCPAAASPERKQRRLLLPQKGRLTGQTDKTA